MTMIGNLFFGAVLIVAGLVLGAGMFTAKPNDHEATNYGAAIVSVILYVVALVWFGILK